MALETTQRRIQKHALPLALIALPILAFHWKIWALGWWITGGDLINQFVPWREFALQEIREGRFPFWNPYVFCGAPFAANIQTALFYPENLLHFFFSTESVYSLSLVIHQMMAGLAMYGFLYSITKNRAAAAFGAVVYAWSGFYITHGHDGHLIHLRAYAWIPFTLWAQAAGSAQWSLKRSALLAACLAMMFYAGHTQIPLYIFYLLMARALWQSLWAWRGGAGWKQLASAPAWTLFSLALAVLLAALVLVPLAQLSQHTAGRAGGADYGFAVSDSMPPSFLAAMIAPLAFGDPTAPVREANFWLTKTGYHELCGYTGLLALIAALLAGVPSAKNAANRNINIECGFFALIGGLGLFFALGEYNPLYPLLYYGLPGWSYFRVPARLVMIFIIGVSVCSSVGLSRWMETDRKILTQSLAVKCAAIFSLLLCITYILVLLSKPAILVALREYEIDQTVFNLKLWTADRRAISARLPEILFETRYAYLMSSLSVANLWMLFGWGSLALIKRSKNSILRYAPLLVLLADLLFFSSRFVPTQSQQTWRETYFPETEITAAISQSARQGRVLLLDDAVGYPGTDAHPELRPNRLMRYGIHSVRGYDPLILRRFARYVNRAYGNPPDAPQGGLLFFPALPNPQVLEDCNVHSFVTAQPPPTAPAPLWSTGRSPLKIYSATGNHEFRLETPSSDMEIQIVKQTPSMVVLNVQTPTPNRLIWSQVYYPNWKAKIGETYTPIEPYKETWISIPIPNGPSLITIQYDASGFKAGIVITATTLTLTILGLFFSRLKRRNR
ncbi:MAG: hypothetical protein P9L94_00070 [Candidatus Hinthialibacter antarcticus]|nr:hypothetical protein [Candidatus Hinthialibacter antarcticus]